MAFQKGKTKTGGRKRGTCNKATREIRALARSLLEDPTYRERLKERIYSGKAPQIEQLLYFYAFGKPTETIRTEGADEPKEFTLMIDGPPPNTLQGVTIAEAR